MKVFEQLESEVRSYCRSFPTVFKKAKAHILIDESDREYIDFFAGAGALNYGHNNERLKRKLIEYLECDSVVHSLDMSTEAKREFLKRFNEVILKPRDLDYKTMFPGPTGTNAVEAALKLARKVTGRTNIVSFTNGFHGMTLGSLALTGNSSKRNGAGVPLENVTSMPFDGYIKNVDSMEVLRRYIADNSSGMDKPAAFIVETIQAEGGVNVASSQWLIELSELAQANGILLIIDDIQVGCGRTGSFFSFERAGIQPDIVCLSKSLSGYGLPFAVTLIKPEFDIWSPGEHNGTFRGHNPAFVTATEALSFWENGDLTEKVKKNGAIVRTALLEMARESGVRDLEVRGLGLIQGIDFKKKGFASEVSAEAFKRGLIIEACGAEDNVLKVLPPLTIDQEDLKAGLNILSDSVKAALAKYKKAPAKEKVHAMVSN